MIAYLLVSLATLIVLIAINVIRDHRHWNGRYMLVKVTDPDGKPIIDGVGNVKTDSQGLHIKMLKGEKCDPERKFPREYRPYVTMYTASGRMMAHGWVTISRADDYVGALKIVMEA